MTDQTYPFLSDAWIAAARKLGEEFEGSIGPPPADVKMNVVVTDIPHRDGDLLGHIDTTTGALLIELGHQDNPTLTLTVDYETARAAFVTRDPAALMQAFFAGKILVDGDASQLMLLQAQPQDAGPEAIEFVHRLDAITDPAH